MSVRWNVLVAWVEHGVKLFVGFFLMTYLLRTMGKETYGIWVFINSLIGYSGLLYMGFGDTISRFTAKYHAKKDWGNLNKIASCVFAFYLGMGMLALTVSVALALCAPFLSDWGGYSLFDVQMTFLILGLSVMTGMCGAAFGGLLIGMQRLDIERGVLVGMGVVRLVLTLFLLSQSYELITLALIYLVVTLMENGLFVYLAFRSMPTLKVQYKLINRESFRECFSFSAYAFLGLIAEFLIYRTDTIVIGLVLGMKAVVPYHVASRLCTYIREPVIQIGEVFLPKAGELYETNKMHQLSKMVLSGMGIAFLLTASAVVGGYYFGDLMIETWLQEKYELVSSHLLVLLLLGQLIALPMCILRRVLFGMGDVRFPAMIYLLEAIANLVLSLILVQYYGLLGVAIGTMIPIVLFELFAILPYAIKRFHFTFKEMLLRVFVFQTIPMLCLWGYSHVLSQIVEARTWGNVCGLIAGALAVLAMSSAINWWLFRSFLASNQQDENENNQTPEEEKMVPNTATALETKLDTTGNSERILAQKTTSKERLPR